MSVVGQDLFTEAVNTGLASHTPDVGAGWTLEVAGSYTVIAADDNLEHNNGVVEMARKGDDVGSADMDVSCNAMSTNSTSRLTGVCGRMTTADFANAIQAYFVGDGGTTVDVKLYSEIGGVRVEDGSYDANIAQATMTALKLSLRTVASVLAAEVFVAGVSRITKTYLTDALAGNQYAGVIGQASGNNSVRLDDFLSESVAAAAGHPAMRRLGMTRFGRPVEMGRSQAMVA